MRDDSHQPAYLGESKTNDARDTEGQTTKWRPRQYKRIREHFYQSTWAANYAESSDM